MASVNLPRRDVLKVGIAGLIGYGARALPQNFPSTADLHGDVEILRQALALHSGLYRYNTPAQIERAITDFRKPFSSARSLAERYMLLSRFTAGIRCGHTYGNFFNQKKVAAADLFDRPTRLPFHFVWSGASMIVLDDPSGVLKRGTEIAEIDGLSPAVMRRRLMPFVRADGHNDAKRVSLLEVRGDESIETFDVFQGLLFPPKEKGGFLLKTGARGEATAFLHVSATDLIQRQAVRTTKDGSGADQPIWDWTMRPDGIAILTMPSWALYDSKWAWLPWLETRLDTLPGANGLIIDLRSNEGGQDCGDPILSRFIDRDFTPPQMEQRLRFQRTPTQLDRYLDTWDDSFRTLGVGSRPLADGFYLRPGGDAIARIPASSKRLRIPLAVLIGPVNSSATFQFAQAVRTAGSGRLYGSTTGGNLRGINGGCFFFVRLPASGLEFDLPLVGNFPLTPQPDGGLAPDVAVTATQEDIIAGRDPVKERAVFDISHRWRT